MPPKLIFAALLVGMLISPSAAETGRPNVVMIVVDDLGWSDLGCYGGTFYETPHIDRLAKQGVRFTDAYATCPVCSPSRASLMTGKYPPRLGVTAHIGDQGPEHWRRNTPLRPANYQGQLDLEETTLAEHFHDAGYATLHAGKWHLGGERHWPEYQGFDVNIGGWSQGGPFGGKQYFSPYANPRLTNGPDGEYLTDRLAEETVRFINDHRFNPFFVHLSFYSVHVPLVARADLLEKYEAKLAKLPVLSEPWTRTADGRVRARQDLPVYAAMVEAMDQAVGRVLKKLEETNLASETIVVFTSDNGGLATGDRGIAEAEGWPTTNAPLRAGKGWLYEGGVRVPLIAKAPGVSQANLTRHDVVTGVDLAPTIADLAGLVEEATSDVDGRSFAAALRGENEPRGPVYWHYPHYGNQGGGPGGAIRDGDWKLIEWFRPDGAHETELYNLHDDLSEEHNLAGEEPGLAAELQAKLASWRAEQLARMPTVNAKYDPKGPVDKPSAGF